MREKERAKHVRTVQKSLERDEVQQSMQVMKQTQDLSEQQQKGIKHMLAHQWQTQAEQALKQKQGDRQLQHQMENQMLEQEQKKVKDTTE